MATAQGSAQARRPGLLWGAFSILLFVGAWQLVVQMRLVPAVFLPGPGAVLAELWKQVLSGQLPGDLAVSFRRLGFGFAIGASAGIVVGLITGRYRIADWIASPFIAGLYTLPKVAMLPLLILWLGIGEEPKITLIAVGCFFPVVINTHAGVRQTAGTLILAARNLGASTGALMRKVFLPSASPYIMAGLRLGLGQALLLVVVAEMLGGTSGIGYSILAAGQLAHSTTVIALLVVFGFLGIGFSVLLRWLERKLSPWADEPEASA